MIKRLMLNLVIIGSVLYMQTTYLHQLEFNNVKPDIALILLIYFSIRNNSVHGVFLGTMTGFFEDVISLAPLGFHSTIKAIIGFLSGFVGSYISVDSVFFHGLTVMIATFVKYLIAALIIALFAIKQSVNPLSNSVFLVELVYNTVMAPVVFTLCNWVVRKFERK